MRWLKLRAVLPWSGGDWSRIAQYRMGEPFRWRVMSSRAVPEQFRICCIRFDRVEQAFRPASSSRNEMSSGKISVCDAGLKARLYPDTGSARDDNPLGRHDFGFRTVLASCSLWIADRYSFCSGARYLCGIGGQPIDFPGYRATAVSYRLVPSCTAKRRRWSGEPLHMQTPAYAPSLRRM